MYRSKMAEEETRDQIEEIIIHELPTKEAILETVIEEEKVKPKPKATKSKAKQITITKQPVEEPASVSEAPQPIVEEPTVEVDKLKQLLDVLITIWK